jgi:hypothetical protein
MNPLSLRTIVESIAESCEEQRAFLNKTTGEFAVIPIHELDRQRSLSDNHSETPEAASQILSSRDWVQLPGPYEIDDFEIMQAFCHRIPDRAVRAELLDLTEGPGAFARFRDAAAQHNLTGDWQAFKKSKYKRFAIEWLEWNGLSYREDI